MNPLSFRPCRLSPVTLCLAPHRNIRDLHRQPIRSAEHSIRAGITRAPAKADVDDDTLPSGQSVTDGRTCIDKSTEKEPGNEADIRRRSIGASGLSHTGVSAVIVMGNSCLCEKSGVQRSGRDWPHPPLGGGAAASRAPVRGRGLPRRRSRPRSVRRPRGPSTSSSGGGPGPRPCRPSSCAWRPKCRGR